MVLPTTTTSRTSIFSPTNAAAATRKATTTTGFALKLLCACFLVTLGIVIGTSYRVAVDCSNSNNHDILSVSNAAGLLNTEVSSSSIAAKSTTDDACDVEYNRISTSIREKGLTDDDLDRAMAYKGNTQRLMDVADNLSQRSVNIVVCGGSITLGHGVTPTTARYSNQLEYTLQALYPQHTHQVHNRGSHGADMCAMAKRLNVIDLPESPDMFILEFGVNDYQGQDHKVHIDHKTDVFFDGFRELALCAEIVVHKLLADHPNAAVVFLEFQTGILNRKTAQILHMGVAQHYQVPMISYADALFPDFYKLIDTLAPYDYSVPEHMDIDTILPYPHGCATCHDEHIVEGFREHGCKSVCVFLKRSGYTNVECDVLGRPCYPPFYAHDAVHPSAAGHGMARDLIMEAIASAGRDHCRGRVVSPKLPLPTHSGFLVAGPKYATELRQRSDFVVVQDTMEVFANQSPLQSNDHSSGFELKGDVLADRKGWQATNAAGGEYVNFEITLPKATCYAIYISVLRSYENVGTFTATVTDVYTNTKTTPVTYDCLWTPQISIPADFQITSDTVVGCTGKCTVTITTNPFIPGRPGTTNRVKITSLAVRKCM